MTYFDLVSAINARMKEIKMHKSTLAETIGVNRSTMSDWLLYKTAIPGDHIFVVLHAVGLDAQLIYKGEEGH